MALALAAREGGASPQGEDDIELRFCAPRNAYPSCAKAFRELYRTRPALAVELLKEARQFLLDKVAAS